LNEVGFSHRGRRQLDRRGAAVVDAETARNELPLCGVGNDADVLTPTTDYGS